MVYNQSLIYTDTSIICHFMKIKDTICTMHIATSHCSGKE